MTTSTTKRRTPRRTAAHKATSANNDIHTAMPRAAVCHACNTLPAGSVELTALMLVLVFSLSAVLFTSVYALQSEQSETAQLQEQVAALQE